MTVLSKPAKSSKRLQPRQPLNWLAGCLLALTSFTAHAENTCDEPASGPSLEAALATLRGLEPLCHKQPQFLYSLGRLLNQAGRYEEAVDSLEGALLYRPDHWPSQLEYAIALEGVGDRSSVLALLQGLLQNPDVDPATRQQIADLQRRPLLAPAANRHGVFSLATGFDNNLLGSTYNTQFTLTTPTGLLPVELDEDQRPRAGAYIRADISYGGLLTADASAQWRYNLAASYRTSPDFTPADVAQFSALVERSATGAQGFYMLGQYQAVSRAEVPALRQTQFGLGYDFVLGSKGPNECQQRLGLDIQHLIYPTSPALNGSYTGVISNTTCAARGLQIQARMGEDQPADISRPGGIQRQISLRVSNRRQLAGGSLALELELAHQEDQSGYSVLLDNNAQRNISRIAYRLEYRWQAGGLNPYVGFEWQDQRSNLTLFELKNRLLAVGVRWGW